jgi:hypothetical protein
MGSDARFATPRFQVMLDFWLGRKVIKRCSQGHRMEPGLRRCPRCFAGAQAMATPRDMAERTVLLTAGAPLAARSVPAVAVAATVVRLRATAGSLAGQLITLSEGTHRFGKAPQEPPGVRAIRIADDPFLSREHAEIRVSGNQVGLNDLGSTNGTCVNGQRVSQAILRDGDELRLGECVFRVEIGSTSS